MYCLFTLSNISLLEYLYQGNICVLLLPLYICPVNLTILLHESVFVCVMIKRSRETFVAFF